MFKRRNLLLMNNHSTDYKVLTRSFAKSLYPLINSYLNDNYYTDTLTQEQLTYYTDLKNNLNLLVKENTPPNNYYFFCSKCLKFIILFSIHKKNKFLYNQATTLKKHFKQFEKF